MKKILAIALTICMLVSCVLVANATVPTTTFEDEGGYSAVGLSVNNRETQGVDSSNIYYFRQDMTNSHTLDTSRTTNYVIAEENGNQCVKFDAYEAWTSDNSQGNNVVSIDLKPTTVTGLAGVIVYGNPYGGCTAQELAQVSGYPTTGVGFTIASDCQSVIVFCTPDDETITYTFDTGLDLTEDWHTYAAYIESGKVTLAIDEKIVATVVSESGVVTIYDNDGNEQASDEGGFYTDDPRCGFMVTGTGMDILGDNLTWTGYESVPTEKFTTLSAHIAVTSDITLCVKANGLNDGTYSVRFTQADKEAVTVETPDGNGYYSYEDIKMSRAGDNVQIELLDGEDVVVTKTLSVMDYLNAIIDGDDATCAEQAANLARLCSAMNVYMGGEGFTFDATKATEIEDSYEYYEYYNSTHATDMITAAALYIDNNINIVFKYKYAEASEIVIKKDGVVVKTETDLSSCKVMTDDINLAELDALFTVNLYNNGEWLGYLDDYSVMDYISDKFYSEGKVADVVKALSVYVPLEE